MGDSKDPEALEALRRRIDTVDAELVKLLNERASIVMEVGQFKRDTGSPIYAPHREAEVLKRALEQPLRIGYLGPPGSFSHVAAVAHFGSSVEFSDLREIDAVFLGVRRGNLDYGLVPIENSTGGAVFQTLDAFRDSKGEVDIYAEVVLAQCRKWLSTQLPDAEMVPTASSSAAVRDVRAANDRNPECGEAAIGSELAGELYGVRVLVADIEDNPNNITRFFIIARQKAKPTGDDKTSIMFSTRDAPGALAEVLKCFADAGVNLTHIDKRPSGRENWHYTFFIDTLGHRDDSRMALAIENARPHCHEISVLGSYPRAARIL